MKKALLITVLMAGAGSVMAQNKLLTPDTNKQLLDKPFNFKVDSNLMSKPLLETTLPSTLNGIGQLNGIKGNIISKLPLAADANYNMPIARLSGNSKMPVVVLEGYSKMPVVGGPALKNQITKVNP